MQVLQVLEHERLPILENPPADVKALGPRHAKALDRLQGRLPKNAVGWERQAVKFSHYCGVIQLDDLSLEILPKVHGKESDPGTCREVLVRMLYATRHLTLHRMGQARVGLQSLHLLDVFIDHFCDDLSHQVRQGMIRQYVTKVENGAFFRGKLLVAQHLRANFANQERVYCEYDELDQDNQFNRVIKYVLQKLLRVARSGATKRSLTELLYLFDDVTDVEVRATDAERITLDRGNRRYASVFEFCEWVLRGSAQDVASGPSSSLALLFDMNRLFEGFVARRIKPLAWEAGYRLREQGPQRRFLLRADTDEEVFVTKPDMTLSDEDDQIVRILDAKWKVIDPSQKKLGISESDLYQVASYALRYGCDQVSLVFPAVAGASDPIRFTIPGTSIELTLLFVDLVASAKEVRWAGWGDFVHHGHGALETAGAQ